MLCKNVLHNRNRVMPTKEPVNIQCFTYFGFVTIYRNKTKIKILVIFFSHKKILKSILGFRKWTKKNVQN